MDENTEVAEISAPVQNIESASAGTACQTTDSNFAYILTATVFGVIAVLLVASTLFAYANADSFITLYSAYVDRSDDLPLADDGFSLDDDSYLGELLDDPDWGWNAVEA